MRRAILLSAVVGFFLAGAGCRHVAGRCDCTNEPGHTPQATPSNYGALGHPVPVNPIPGTPAPMPASPEKLPATSEK